MENPSLEVKVKTVLILGDFSLESVEDKIVALGHTFQKRSLGSQPCDWIEIEKDLKQINSGTELLAVLLFLSESTLFNRCTPEHLEVWYNLLTEMRRASSVVFIPQDYFIEKFYNDKFKMILEGIDQSIQDIRTVISQNNLNQTIDESMFNKIKNKAIRSISINIGKISKFINTSGKISPTEDLVILMQDIILIEPKLNTLLELAASYRINKENSRTKKYLRNKRLQIIERAIEDLETSFQRLQSYFGKKLPEQLQRVKQLLQIIQTSGVEIVPYKTKTDISLTVHHFLDEIDKGIIFHLYVPNGRYQEDQLASLLRLFESYLRHVEKLQFSIDIKRTLHGQVYEFKSKDSLLDLRDMEDAISRFESFMSLCQNDQRKAEALLLRTGMNPSDASRLMTKYVKEYQRLLLDIEHERERKLLDLRQRLESDAFELAHDTSLAVPQSVQPTALLSLSHNLDPLSITISNSSVIINPGIQSHVEQAIYGDIHYTTQDKELLHLFETYAEGLEAVRLKSDLEQLKDTSSSEVERKTAKQKIVGFLSRVAPSIGQSALTVLAAYVEKVLIGK